MENESGKIKFFAREIWIPDNVTIKIKRYDCDNRTVILTFKCGKGRHVIKFTCNKDICNKFLFNNFESDKDEEILHHFYYGDYDVYIIKYHNFILVNDMVFKHVGNMKPAKEITTFKEFCDIFGMDVDENPKLGRDNENTHHLSITRENGTILHLSEDYSARYAYLAVIGVDGNGM